MRPLATVCLLTYGDYLPYYQRCLDSILETTPHDQIELRLGFNASPSGLRYALERLGPVDNPVRRSLSDGVELLTLRTDTGLLARLWCSSVNLYKEPMSRLMYYSVPLESEYAVWFDDDSIVARGWWHSLRGLLDQHVDYIGQEWWVDYLPGQAEMIRAQPWYRGVPFASRDGKSGARFITGGFMAVRTTRLAEANFPDTSFCWKGDTLKQYGGDTLLGEIARQLGWTRAVHSTFVHVNVDLQGKHPAPRRGGTGRQFGSDINVVIR
jgi:hypothetical protein